MNRDKARFFVLRVAVVATILFSLSAVFAGTSNAAPQIPTATTCAAPDQPAPTIESNPNGEFISFGVKFQCSAPVEYNISLFLRVNNGSGFTDVTFCDSSGVSQAPSCFSDTNFCTSFTTHPYLTELDATVNGVFHSQDSASRQLACVPG